MKRVELVSLELQHFMGVESFTLDVDGQSAVVRGTNGCGKTTLATAFSWLLTGKDSRGQADFEVKSIDPASGEALHNLEHAVEATLRVDGNEVTLRRAFVEVWTRKRGASQAEFTGHETKFWIDGVPMGTKKEFDERVGDLLPLAAWRELTNPDAWHAQHWAKRRQDLIDMCGDVSDEDVIAADKALADLPGILGRHTPDEHRKVLEARRREVNSELKTIPARIDEVRIGLVDLPNVAQSQVEAGLASARAERAAVETERAALKAGGADAAGPRKRLAEIEDAMAALEREARAAADEADRAARLHRQRLTDAVADAESAVKRLERERSNLTSDVKAAELRVERLRDEWASVHARKPDVHTPNTCPACKQALPADRVAEAHAAALAQFNERKAAELERVQASGKEQAAQVAELERHLADIEARLAVAAESLTATQAALGDAGDTLPEPPDPRATKPWVALDIERKQLTEQIKTLQAGEDGALDKLDEEAERLDALIASFESDAAAFTTHKRGTDRINELTKQEKLLASQLEEAEHHLHLIERFVRAKSAMLTDRINSRFQITRFRLFEDQINGGLTDACTALVGNVPYAAGLNRAARINSGLDIIAVLQEHHGVAVPVLVDECESVVELLPIPTQVIRLVVDDHHDELHVELEKELEAVA